MKERNLVRHQQKQVAGTGEGYSTYIPYIMGPGMLGFLVSTIDQVERDKLGGSKHEHV